MSVPSRDQSVVPATSPDLPGFLAAIRALDAPAVEVVRALASRLRPDGRHGLEDLPPIPPGLASPWLLGQVREALHARDRRTALGAWFTPPAVARALVATVDHGGPVGSVLDPACGGGAFLLAAHEAYPDARLAGRDVDPVAVEATQTALQLAGCGEIDAEVGDGLAVGGGRYDLVVGNPPFLSQLRTATVRDEGRRQALRRRFGAAAGRYVDEVGLFVLASATDQLAEGGVAVLVVPESLLATVDAAGLRAVVADLCNVEVVWRDVDGVFPGVPTCAVRLVRRPKLATAPRRVIPPHPDPLDTPRGVAWSHLLAADVPQVVVDDSLALVRDVASATADFRDTYYLLAEHVAERVADEGYPIVPVGLIDPAHLRFGEAPVTFAKRRWQRPVAVGLPPAFLTKRLGPKVLLATQTKVLEALVDVTGDLLPSTPVITLRTEQPWHLAAALTSPTLTALALRRHAGAARARGALKLSAAQVLALPLPQAGRDWDAAAEAVRAAHAVVDPEARAHLLLACGAAADRAYGATGIDPADLLEWWRGRLPRRPA